MRFVSTRGEAPALSFEGALLAGLARDGGLYDARGLAAANAGRDRRSRRPRLCRCRLPHHAPLSRRRRLPAPTSRPCSKRPMAASITRPSRRSARSAQRVAARAVSRADARLQGPRHAGGGAADEPRAHAQAARAPPWSAPPRATPVPPPSRPFAASTRSTSSSCIPRAASATCSAGR